MSLMAWFFSPKSDAVDGCKILHQLVDGQSPVYSQYLQCFIVPNSYSYQLVQDFFLPQYDRPKDWWMVGKVVVLP